MPKIIKVKESVGGFCRQRHDVQDIVYKKLGIKRLPAQAPLDQVKRFEHMRAYFFKADVDKAIEKAFKEWNSTKSHFEIKIGE